MPKLNHLALAFLLPAFPAIATPTLTTLYTLPAPSFGFNNSGVIIESGILYGATRNGTGASGHPNSVVYSLTPPTSGTSWTETTIANFSPSSNGTGLTPGGDQVFGKLHADAAGRLFGTTEGGGVATGNCSNNGLDGCGVVFELTKSGSSWTKTILYSFLGGTDGQVPVGGLISDAAGNLFGVTASGGTSANCFDGCGTVYELVKPITGTSWTEKLLYSFQGVANGTTSGDGAIPNASLLLHNGALYGTTQAGGNVIETGGNEVCYNSASNYSSSCGVVYRLKLAGTKWKETILYKFSNGADGSSPQSGLVVDSDGDFYGAAMQGGVTSTACTDSGFSGCGVVFKLTKPVAPAITYGFSSLYAFPGNNGAQAPIGVLIDKKRNLFGTAAYTPNPGSGCSAGTYYCGAVFSLTAPITVGGAYTYTPLHSFTGVTSNDNGLPAAPLTVDKLGNLYGVTMYSQTGTVFSLTGSGY